MHVNSSQQKAAQQVPSGWWAFNLRLVSLGVCIWLILTLLGSMAAERAVVSALQFVVAAQWIPISYLLLVVAYCMIINARMTKEARQYAEKHLSSTNEDSLRDGR